MEGMIEKYNDLPQEAKYVIMGAGGLIALLVVIVLMLVVIRALRSGSSSGSASGPGKVKVPKRLPIAPIPMMNDREHALHRVLLSAIEYFPGYEVHAKVSTMVMLGARKDEHPKVAAAVIKSIEHDAHDFVIVDSLRYPIAVVELDSRENDTREEQARRAGLVIIRVKDPRVSPMDMVERLRSVLT